MCMAKTRKEQVETRVSLALKRIELVGDLINKFEFTEEETNRIFGALSSKIRTEKKRYKRVIEFKNKYDPFSFDN